MASMGHGGMGGMKAADRPLRGTGKAVAADLSKMRPKPKLKDIWPEIWALVRPRRWLLLGSFGLMVVNRACSLVLPMSFKPLIDHVFIQRQMHVLPYVVGAVVLATVIQGVTSYTLTQLLSKSGQKLIAELRMQVQVHVGRLPVRFYDENRTGTLVARIMSDVEGVRNIIGTGILDFVGGVLTAVFAFGYLMKQSVPMTLVTFTIMLGFAGLIQRAFKTIRPIFRERSKINSEVAGRLTESLGGVRVVKGYHADGAVGDDAGFDGDSWRGWRRGDVYGRAVELCGQDVAGWVLLLCDDSGVYDRADCAAGEHRNAVDRGDGGDGPYARDHEGK